MNAESIKQRIIEATGATDVRVSGDGSGGYWMADFHSPNGGHVLHGQFEAAGFRQESLFYNGGGEWAVGLFDTQPAPAPTFAVGQRVETDDEDNTGVIIDIMNDFYIVDFGAGSQCAYKADEMRLRQPGDALPASDPAGDCGADPAPMVTAAYDDDEPMTYERPGFVHCACCTQHLQADVAYKGDDGKVYCDATCELEAQLGDMSQKLADTEGAADIAIAVLRDERDALRARLGNARAEIERQIAVCETQIKSRQGGEITELGAFMLLKARAQMGGLQTALKALGEA